MAFLKRIELDARVCNGKPVIKATRIPVSIIIEQIAEGDAWEKVLENYPEITREDIQAALIYARDAIENTEIRVAAYV